MQSSMQKSGFSANELLRCLGILGGTLLYSLGMNLFVVPAGLYTGGIMGLSQLLRTFLLQWAGWTPKIDIAGFINYAINLPMLLLAWKRLDHRIVLKTLLFPLPARRSFSPSSRARTFSPVTSWQDASLAACSAAAASAFFCGWAAPRAAWTYLA